MNFGVLRMARQKKTANPATELEAAVLGVLWRDGLCTPYAIRQHFRESRSPRWSGSAGAIYPLARRLEMRGLVRSKHRVRGKREQRDYRITPRGVAALRKWIRTPLAQTEATLVHDPLRTRVFFLAAIPRDEARSFVSDALHALRLEALRAKEDCRNSANDKCSFSYLAARNALLVTRVRIRWLIEVREALGKRTEC